MLYAREDISRHNTIRVIRNDQEVFQGTMYARCSRYEVHCTSHQVYLKYSQRFCSGLISHKKLRPQVSTIFLRFNVLSNDYLPLHEWDPLFLRAFEGYCIQQCSTAIVKHLNRSENR